MKACCVHSCGRTSPCRSGLSPAGSGGWGTYVVGGPESLQLEVALQAVPEARLKLIGQPRHPFEPRTRQQRLHRLQVLTEREKGQNAFDLPQNIKLLQLLWATFLLIKKKWKRSGGIILFHLLQYLQIGLIRLTRWWVRLCECVCAHPTECVLDGGDGEVR